MKQCIACGNNGNPVNAEGVCILCERSGGQISIFFTNFGYGPSQSFYSVQSAVEYGRSKGFEFSVWFGDDLLASWSPIGGLRQHIVEPLGVR